MCWSIKPTWKNKAYEMIAISRNEMMGNGTGDWTLVEE